MKDFRSPVLVAITIPVSIVVNGISYTVTEIGEEAFIGSSLTGATIGKFTMVPKTSETILVNQRVGKFFLGNNPIDRIPFIYSTLKQPEIISEVINRGQGSAQPNISAADILSIPCVIPKSTEINDYNQQASPMFELIINNQFENLVLAQTRDALLPQLMSGELDISAIDL